MAGAGEDRKLRVLAVAGVGLGKAAEVEGRTARWVDPLRVSASSAQSWSDYHGCEVITRNEAGSTMGTG
jgi:hypothetical protein